MIIYCKLLYSLDSRLCLILNYKPTTDMSNEMSRRTFLKAGTAAAIGLTMATDDVLVVFCFC